LIIPDTSEGFQQVFLSYREVKEANPTWSERMVEDYMSMKQDILLTSDSSDAAVDILNKKVFNLLQNEAGNSSDIGKIRSVANNQKRVLSLLSQLVAELVIDNKADRQYITELLSDNGKLRASINGQFKAIKNINQQLVDLQ
jgi:hypothetical protein